MDKKIDLLICLGSSCFSRGNNTNLDILKTYIEDNNLHDKITFKGKLCSSQCSSGPNITINGTTYKEVNAVSVIRIIEEMLNQ